MIQKAKAGTNYVIATLIANWIEYLPRKAYANPIMGKGNGGGSSAGAELDGFASLRFTDDRIRELIDQKHFDELAAVRAGKKALSPQLLSVMSKALGSWALGKGATHYTHWFQPLTMHVAGKQNSLIRLSREEAVYGLSPEDLLFGESDASSLPSGGLRSTFEARGILEWDLSSFAFIKECKDAKVLHIPTKFTSFNRQSLDLKTPLLASIDSMRKNALPLVNLVNRALGLRESETIKVMVGPEQEFFLIDKELCESRPDLSLSGRTVMGSLGTVGEYSVEHYYGGLSERVQRFFQDLNRRLYKIGIVPSTQHREAAPNQFEIALHYGECNAINDENLIAQEMISDVAGHYGLAALFDEKPFFGVNGSGKHTNWSISLDGGENLFSPGKTREEMARFLFFTSVFIAAVDECQDLLRCAVASYSNDARLSQKEAPPCIISVYLGEALDGMLSSGFAEIGNAKALGGVFGSDRNRTSPIAFTGNKFEFRPTGSAQSISTVCAFLNAAFSSMCERLMRQIEDGHETAESLRMRSAKLYGEHRRIVFNDNCYSAEWSKEAARRGLDNLPTALQAIPSLTKEKNARMLESLGILNKAELESRRNIMISSYIRSMKQDATLLVEMIRRSVIPAIRDSLAKDIEFEKAIGDGVSAWKNRIARTKDLFAGLLDAESVLEEKLKSLDGINEFDLDDALLAQRELLPLMRLARESADAIEKVSDKRIWPFSSYDSLLRRI